MEQFSVSQPLSQTNNFLLPYVYSVLAQTQMTEPNLTIDQVECSGNGICGPCDVCVCFTDRPGSQYFDTDNFCADICMTTNDCDDCFNNPNPGRCDMCHFPLIKQSFNESLLQQRDELHRNVWIQCNDTLDGCNFEYVAMRVNEETHYMVTKSCDPVEEKQITGGVNGEFMEIF